MKTIFEILVKVIDEISASLSKMAADINNFIKDKHPVTLEPLDWE